MCLLLNYRFCRGRFSVPSVAPVQYESQTGRAHVKVWLIATGRTFDRRLDRAVRGPVRFPEARPYFSLDPPPSDLRRSLLDHRVDVSYLYLMKQTLTRLLYKAAHPVDIRFTFDVRGRNVVFLPFSMHRGSVVITKRCRWQITKHGMISIHEY